MLSQISAIRLSLIQWLLSLVLSLMVVCGEGWKSNWLGSVNEIFINWLCLHQLLRLGGTAHYTTFQDWDKFFGLL